MHPAIDHPLVREQPPILVGGNFPRASKNRLALTVCAIAIAVLGIGIACHSVAKPALTALLLTAKILCLAHPISAAIVGGVIAVAVIVAAVVLIIKLVKHIQHQTLCKNLNKQLLDIARGWHTPEEAANRAATRMPFVCSYFGGKVLNIQSQGHRDITREAVTVAERDFPLPPTLPTLPPLSQNTIDRVTRERQEKRVLDIMSNLHTLFDDDARLSDERAAEVMTFLCAQTVAAPLELALMNLHCKDSAGNLTKVISANANIPRVHSININDQNEVVFVSAVSYETHAFDDPEGPIQNQITVHVETRIPKETILSKSMEELQAQDCTFNYLIKVI